jgi:hypothetical protein
MIGGKFIDIAGTNGRLFGKPAQYPWLPGLGERGCLPRRLSRQIPGVGGSLGEGGTPEPKRVAIEIITRKGKFGRAAEKFCQCAKEAFSGGR